jgi:hypothetical protein
MSDWIECPKCPAVAKARAVELRQIANEEYGHVSQEEWQALHDKAVEAERFQPGYTAREYTEIGFRANGEFYIDYGLDCEVCGFSFSFDHKDPDALKGSG